MYKQQFVYFNPRVWTVRSQFLDLLRVFLKQFLQRPFLVTHRVSPRSRLHRLWSTLTFQERQFRLGPKCHAYCFPQTSSLGLSFSASELAWVCFALLLLISFSSLRQMGTGQQIILSSGGCSYKVIYRAIMFPCSEEKVVGWVICATYEEHILETSSFFVHQKEEDVVFIYTIVSFFGLILGLLLGWGNLEHFSN